MPIIRMACGLAVLLLAACAPHASEDRSNPMNANPVSYFEIPVTDMDRAAAFYADVLQTDLERAVVDGYDMALFPPNAMGPGASGALAKGDVYVPSLHGPIIYFTVSDIDAALSRARIRGAELLFAKKEISEGTFVAEVRDSEGNRMALIQRGD
jgi:hypothetical protein